MKLRRRIGDQWRKALRWFSRRSPAVKAACITTVGGALTALVLFALDGDVDEEGSMPVLVVDPFYEVSGSTTDEAPGIAQIIIGDSGDKYGLQADVWNPRDEEILVTEIRIAMEWGGWVISCRMTSFDYYLTDTLRVVASLTDGFRGVAGVATIEHPQFIVPAQALYHRGCNTEELAFAFPASVRLAPATHTSVRVEMPRTIHTVDRDSLRSIWSIPDSIEWDYDALSIPDSIRLDLASSLKSYESPIVRVCMTTSSGEVIRVPSAAGCGRIWN